MQPSLAKHNARYMAQPRNHLLLAVIIVNINDYTCTSRYWENDANQNTSTGRYQESNAKQNAGSWHHQQNTVWQMTSFWYYQLSSNLIKIPALWSTNQTLINKLKSFLWKRKIFFLETLLFLFIIVVVVIATTTNIIIIKYY